MKSVRLTPRAAAADDEVSTPSGPVADQERFEALAVNHIVVADRLDKPHPLVARSIIAFRRAKPDDHGILKPKGDCLDVQVTLDSSDRAMCILDALLKGLDVRGYTTTIQRNGDIVNTIVRIGEEDIRISLSEQVNRVELQQEKRKQSVWAFRQYEWTPTGKLSLRIEGWSPGARQTWTDGKQQRVENCLNHFIVGLVVVAEAERASRLEREQREREYRQAEEQRILELRRLEEEASRARALINAADQWRTARNIRNYLMKMRESLEHHPEVPLELREWMNWANQFADQIDPLTDPTAIPADPHPPERLRRAW
jgi:hypothetical protein